MVPEASSKCKSSLCVLGGGGKGGNWLSIFCSSHGGRVVIDDQNFAVYMKRQLPFSHEEVIAYVNHGEGGGNISQSVWIGNHLPLILWEGVLCSPTISVRLVCQISIHQHQHNEMTVPVVPSLWQLWSFWTYRQATEVWVWRCFSVCYPVCQGHRSTRSHPGHDKTVALFWTHLWHTHLLLWLLLESSNDKVKISLENGFSSVCSKADMYGTNRHRVICRKKTKNNNNKELTAS